MSRLNPDAQPIVEAVDEAIAAMKHDGRFAEIARKRMAGIAMLCGKR